MIIHCAFINVFYHNFIMKYLKRYSYLVYDIYFNDYVINIISFEV